MRPLRHQIGGQLPADVLLQLGAHIVGQGVGQVEADALTLIQSDALFLLDGPVIGLTRLGDEVDMGVRIHCTVRNLVLGVSRLVPSERNIYRSAKMLVDQHGDEAPIHAAMRADALHENGDLDGYAVWRGIIRAIDELLRDKLEEGERLQ